MTVLTYEEKKYINQSITTQSKEDDLNLKVYRMDWFDQAWLPATAEINPIKLGIFANYRYTRLRKIIFCLRNFDEVNMFTFNDGATHMHVPRLLGFRYTTDYQDLMPISQSGEATLDEYELEYRFV